MLRGPSRVGVPGRERHLRGALRSEPDRVRRAPLALDPIDGRQGRGATHDAEPRARPDPGERRRRRERGVGARARGLDGLSGAAQGGRRRRRARAAARRGAPAEIEDAFGAASAEAASAFANGEMYLERYIEGGRHIEIQVLGDGELTIPLRERECSVQRRHQKLLEESPSPALDRDTARRASARARPTRARALGYRRRRHDGDAPRRRGRPLVHGDEHAPPGRAHASPRCSPASTSWSSQLRVAANEPPPRRADVPTATRSSAASTRRTRRRASARRPASSRRLRFPRGRRHPRRHPPPRGRRGPAALRLHDLRSSSSAARHARGRRSG